MQLMARRYYALKLWKRHKLQYCSLCIHWLHLFQVLSYLTQYFCLHSWVFQTSRNLRDAIQLPVVWTRTGELHAGWLDDAGDWVVVVIVVVSVLVHMATSVLPTSGDSRVLGGAAVDNAGVLDPLRDLPHRSAVVASSVLVPPVVVRQRDGFRFRSSDPTGNSSASTVVRTAVLSQWQWIRLGAGTGAAITRGYDGLHGVPVLLGRFTSRLRGKLGNSKFTSRRRRRHCMTRRKNNARFGLHVFWSIKNLASRLRLFPGPPSQVDTAEEAATATYCASTIWTNIASYIICHGSAYRFHFLRPRKAHSKQSLINVNNNGNNYRQQPFYSRKLRVCQ